MQMQRRRGRSEPSDRGSGIPTRSERPIVKFRGRPAVHQIGENRDVRAIGGQAAFGVTG